MTTRITDKLRVKLAALFLDWAEKRPKATHSSDAEKSKPGRKPRGKLPLRWKLSIRLPQLKLYNDTVAELQLIRKLQRSDAERTYEQTRPREGIEVEPLFLRLIEVFHIEDFDYLYKGIVRLFPSQGGFTYENLAAEFRRYTNPFAGTGGWMRLGVITQDDKTWLGMTRDRVMPELPQEVHYIMFKLHKVLPSVFVVTFDVYLRSEAKDRVKALQTAYYLPSIRFRYLLPIGFRRSGYTGTTAEREMRRAIYEYVDQIRGDIEACIKPYMSGYFMRQSVDNVAHLPALEVYALRGAPEDKTVFSNWKDKTTTWWRSLGFDFDFMIYSTGKLLFSWSGDTMWRTYDLPVHRPVQHLIVLWEAYLSAIPDKRMFGGSDRHAVEHHVELLLDDMLPFVTVLRFFESIEENITTVRKNAFESMRPGAQLGHYIKLNETIQRESVLFDRVTSEFERWLEQTKDEEMRIEELQYAGVVGSKKEQTLRGDLTEIIRQHTNHLKQQIQHLDSSFSNFVAARNMDITYRIQLIVIGLTIVIGIPSIIQLILSWDQIQQFVQKIWP